MSPSLKHVNQWRTRGRVVLTYRGTDLTLQEIATKFKISLQSTLAIVHEDIPEAERRLLKARRYANSKLGEKNPALGKKPGNFIGQCHDGYGYLTEVVEGKRYFSHRVVAAKMLCIPINEFSSDLHVHHIDENKMNNDPNNLAIVTCRGHRRLHQSKGKCED